MRWARVRVGVLLVGALALGACGGDGAEDELRLGYFPNVTHATPIVGLERGSFVEALPGVKVIAKPFLSGPELVTALLAGDIDAGYAGPAPIIVAASRAPGRMWIAAGAAEGGAMFVARKGSRIRAVADLPGRSISVPAFGNTQDVTLRLMLERIGERPSISGGGVTMLRIRNGDLINAVRSGVVDAAIAPEPWGSQLVLDGLADRVLGPGELLGTERELTTVLVVSERLVSRHPERVEALLRANETATRLVARDPDGAATALADEIERQSGRRLSARVLAAAIANTTPTTRLSASVVQELVAGADRAAYLGSSLRASDVLLSARSR